MSFRTALDGLQIREAGSAENGIALDGMEILSFTQGCTNYYGIEEECPASGDGIDGFALNLSTVTFDRAAEYFAVYVQVTRPILLGTGCHTPDSPTDSPCGGGGDDAYFDGDVSGSYLTPVSDEAVALPTMFNEFVGSPGARPFTIADTAGYLVNPSPFWSVPDSAGNTFGRCLFRLDQLPAAIDVVISHHNREQAAPGLLGVGVLAYYPLAVEPLGTVRISTSSPGTHKAKRFVGRGGNRLRIG
jgi:hypothetical protein